MHALPSNSNTAIDRRNLQMDLYLHGRLERL